MPAWIHSEGAIDDNGLHLKKISEMPAGGSHAKSNSVMHGLAFCRENIQDKDPMNISALCARGWSEQVLHMAGCGCRILLPTLMNTCSWKTHQ
jgi:hypothetical protein